MDIADERALRKVLTGCESGFYLVHSLGARTFVLTTDGWRRGSGGPPRRRGSSASCISAGSARTQSRSILASRQEVGTALGSGGVPVVELRAAVVLGAGSISFEMLRYLTERLPFMICPRWVHTTIQPIAVG